MRQRKVKFGLYEMGKQQAARSRSSSKQLLCDRAPDRVMVIELAGLVYGNGLVNRDPMVIFRKFNDFGRRYAWNETSFLSHYRFVTKNVVRTVNQSEKVYGPSVALKKALAEARKAKK